MLSANVTERIIVDDSLQDLDVSTNEWKPLPGCDLYAAGFPCTPWSRHHLSSCQLFAFIIMSDCWWMVKFESWRTSHKGVKNNMSSHAMSFHVITSCQIMSCHVMSYRVFPTCQDNMFRRGKGGGFTDESSEPFFAAVQTIKVQQPKCFLLECVDAMAVRHTSASEGTIAGELDVGAESNDLAFVEALLQERLPEYTFVILRQRTPLRFGYPMLRPRFYAIGIGGTKLSQKVLHDQLSLACDSVTVQPLPDFLTFLGILPRTLDGNNFYIHSRRHVGLAKSNH